MAAAASNLVKKDERRLSHLEVEALLNVADDTLGPSAIAEDRASLAVVERALAELSERQRTIFEEASRQLQQLLGMKVSELPGKVVVFS